MAITQTLCASFKQEILLGVHDLDTDVLKIALFTEAALLNASTTVYITANETTGIGYIAGGNTLTDVTVSLENNVAFVDFSNTSWSNASFSASGAMIYNATKGNKAIAVLSFGGVKIANNTTFEVQFPANGSNTAIIRIA